MRDNNETVSRDAMYNLQMLCDEFHRLDEEERIKILRTKLKRPDMRAAKQHEIEL